MFNATAEEGERSFSSEIFAHEFGSFIIGFGLLLQLIYNKYDEVGIVVFGTEGLSISSSSCINLFIHKFY